MRRSSIGLGATVRLTGAVAPPPRARLRREGLMPVCTRCCGRMGY
jgi:hypothetical protein